METTAAAAAGVDPVGLGEKVRKVREGLGWTRFDLSTRTGLRENTIYRIEIGQGMPSIDSIVRIARAAGVPVDDLTGAAA